MKSTPDAGWPKNRRAGPQARATLGARFRVLCADTGLSVEDAAQLLHVTPRTVYEWNSGRRAVPYAAYKLIRVLRWFELPGDQWRGWHFAAGKLWSPEGFGFEPQDAAWWSLLVRQARGFRALYEQQTAGRPAPGKLAPPGAGTAAAGASIEPESSGREVLVTPPVSLTAETRKTALSPENVN